MNTHGLCTGSVYVSVCAFIQREKTGRGASLASTFRHNPRPAGNPGNHKKFFERTAS